MRVRTTAMATLVVGVTLLGGGVALVVGLRAALTDPVERSVRRQAEAAGAVGFFAKPFDARLMIDCIERTLLERGDP